MKQNIVDVARFGAFTAMKIQIEVLWVVTLCGFVVGYYHYTKSQPRKPQLGFLIVHKE
jgi:hypothetical protein